MCPLIVMSASIMTPRSRTEHDDMMSNSPMRGGFFGICCWRQENEHERISVLAWFGCRRLDFVYRVTSSTHADTLLQCSRIRRLTKAVDLRVISVGMGKELTTAHQLQQVGSVQQDEEFRMGFSTDPCGTRNSTGSDADMEVEVRTCCTRPVRHDSNHLITVPLTPYVV
jgi:hypothetical protein